MYVKCSLVKLHAFFMCQRKVTKIEKLNTYLIDNSSQVVTNCDSFIVLFQHHKQEKKPSKIIKTRNIMKVLLFITV